MLMFDQMKGAVFGGRDPILLGALGHPDLVRVSIRNVSEYFFEISDKEHWSLTDDFPCCVLPYESMWFEYPYPRKLNGANGVIDVADVVREAGMQFGIHMMTAREESGRWKMVADIYTLRKDRNQVNCEFTIRFELDETGHIVLPLSIYASEELVRDAREIMRLKRSGQLCEIGLPEVVRESISTIPTRAEDTDGFLTEQARSMLNPVFLALSLMNCKNVTTVDVPVNEKINKKRIRNNRPPLSSHKTIVIDGMREVVQRRGGGSAAVVSAIRHHIRAGSFATYGENGRGLLFGKHVGTFWRPMTAVGDRNAGTVTKEFAVDLNVQG